MATISEIKFKRSKTAGKKPAISDIKEGELAINLVDKKLFTNDGSAIVDLTLRSGGTVDGDLTVTGAVKANTVDSNGNITSENGEIRSNAGIITSKAKQGSNAHVWFDGEEVTGTNRNGERAVIYSNSQTTSGGGAISYRVYDKSNSEANTGAAFFHMYGTGDFDASRDINATRDLNGQRAKLMVSVQTPQVITNNINTNAAPFQTQSYGWEDLRTYIPGNDVLALNYVYKGRSHQGGTIWHHLIDERNGASEWALYTGSGPEFEQFSIKNGDINGGLGLFKNSLAVGDFYSTLGKGSIAIGDNDTGFRSDGDGAFSLLVNNSILATYSGYNETHISYRKPIEIISTNGSNIPVLPANNSALVKIDTSTDGNNAAGNGLTFIGYNADNKYHHYFRGNGAFVVQMGQGLNIISGGLNATGNSRFSNNLTANTLWSETDLFLTNNTRRHIVFRYNKSDGTSDEDGYIFKDGVDSPNRRTGIRIIASTPNKTSGNIKNSSEFVFDENGNFVLPPNGTIVQDDLDVGVYAQSILHKGPAGNKNYLRRFRGDTGNTIFHETVQGSDYRISTGSTDSQDEMVISSLGRATFRGEVISYAANSLNQFRAVGGSLAFFIRNDGASTYFMLTDNGDPLGSYNGFRPITINNSNGNVTIGHAGASHATQINGTLNVLSTTVLQGTLTVAGAISTQGRNVNGEYGGAVNITGESNGDGGALISGAVGGGGWDQWQSRPAGILVSCRAADTSAHSIWKATKWGAYHIAAMDVHSPNGSAIVRMVLNNGVTASWDSSGYSVSHAIRSGGDITSGAWVYAAGRVYPGDYANFDARYQPAGVSDESLKDKIKDHDINRSLKNINELEFKTFEYKDSPGIERRGIIAQQAKEVDDEYVREVFKDIKDEDGKVIDSETYLALDTNPLLMDALAAIKVLSAQVKELQTKLAGQK